MGFLEGMRKPSVVQYCHGLETFSRPMPVVSRSSTYEFDPLQHSSLLKPRRASDPGGCYRVREIATGPEGIALQLISNMRACTVHTAQAVLCML